MKKLLFTAVFILLSAITIMAADSVQTLKPVYPGCIDFNKHTLEVGDTVFIVENDYRDENGYLLPECFKFFLRGVIIKKAASGYDCSIYTVKILINCPKCDEVFETTEEYSFPGLSIRCIPEQRVVIRSNPR